MPDKSVTTLLIVLILNLSILGNTDSTELISPFAGLDLNEDFKIGFEDLNGNEFNLGGDLGSEEPAPVLENVAQIGKLITVEAVALLKGPGKTQGIIRLKQISSGPTHVYGFVSGLTPFGKHGIHVHEYGVNGDCESAGEHYNPTQQAHGSPNDLVSHVGDLGNLHANGKGVARIDETSVKLSLIGKWSVIRRSLVVHFYQDDLGQGYNHESRKSGNSGGRLACGTIKFVGMQKD